MNYRAFQTRLRELGYNEGQNLVVERGVIDDPRGTFAAAAELIAVADHALFEAKSMGRNRISSEGDDRKVLHLPLIPQTR